ncbi:MAG: 3-deoxy-manno-octulosonate cytidylyltransferase, partial [Candidatus Omnitrophica bacterium]|nr:3-deoxy-manno-octulosonate cytidylyltransferase [Candidatus Omnitrophota bacterium]
MKIIGIIPSRLKSLRLPNKALLDIEGLPMIVHVFKRAQLCSGLDDVIVATDSKEIVDVVCEHGGKAVMTSPEHQTGSDRIAEVARNLDADIIVNIQGDEALLDPGHIDQTVAPLLNDPTVNVSMLVSSYKERNRFSDIKAVLDLKGNILYSSRTDIPNDSRNPVENLWKICFLVSFRKDFLMTFASWDQTPLEKIEFQEYLRILEHGYKMRAVPVE